MALSFKRIQFTPDLMPSDITGTELLQEDPTTHERRFKFQKGPVFTNLLLADEINRTPPKTQAALLEAMQEKRVSSGGEEFVLDKPFFVLATQNPIEQEGNVSTARGSARQVPVQRDGKVSESGRRARYHAERDQR